MIASTVDKTSDARDKMVEKSKLPRTLMGGTAAMRLAGQQYLPKEPKESDAAYKNRVARTTLFNGFRKTVKDMTGKVFRREVMIGDDMPPLLVKDAENIDLAGRHLNVFARDVLYDAMTPGIGYIFAEMPKPLAIGRVPTVAEEAAAGIRPYLIYIPLEQVLGWKAKLVAGVQTLTQFRFKESVTEDNGDFGEKTVEQIRVLEPGKWRTFRKNDKDEWVQNEEGVTSLNAIPIAPVYINRTGFMTGTPPLEDLADLNVAHWQSQSDQRNILHVVRVPMLFGSGFQKDDDLVVGANSATLVSNENADLKYVEHGGEAIGSGEKDLERLESQMQTQGLALLVQTPGGKTATGENLDQEKENSPLSMMANALGDALEQAFGFMAAYRGIVAGSITVNTDFGVTLDGLTVGQLLDMRNSNQIDQETYLNELKRRDVLSESVDVEVVIERTKNDQVMTAPAGQGLPLVP